MSRLGQAAFALAIFGVVAATAEIVARLDDLIRFDVPFYTTPDHALDLTVRDSGGTHGRPYGRYQKWKLNNAGFRGPDIEPYAPRGCIRIMALGASETFGYYESPAKEYVAQLRDSLSRGGCFEVVNAAMVGIALPTMTQLWTNWASRYHPDIVLIYPSPAFYLSDQPPEYPPAVAAQRSPDRPFDLRIVARAKDKFEVPDWLQRRRVQHTIATHVAGRPPQWFFSVPPPDRLELFARHLDSILTAIQVTSASPVLITHAMRFSNPVHAEDESLLESWRQFSPRATSRTLLGFETAAARVVREVGARRHVPVVDAAPVLNGHSEWFGDAIHFTDSGAAAMAGSLARDLRVQVAAHRAAEHGGALPLSRPPIGRWPAH